MVPHYRLAIAAFVGPVRGEEGEGSQDCCLWEVSKPPARASLTIRHLPVAGSPRSKAQVQPSGILHDSELFWAENPDRSISKGDSTYSPLATTLPFTMSKAFTVKTEPGNPNSLKESVKIAFTITPVHSGKPTHPCSPVARWVTKFDANTTKSVTVRWSRNLWFGTYKVVGGRCETGDLSGPLSSPGYAVTLTSPTTWSSSVPCNEPTSYIATNRSGSTAMVRLSMGWANVAYHALSHGSTIVAPSGFVLQAYIVNDIILDNSILQQADLRRPIFTSPISCDVLPDASTWSLCQDEMGGLKIKNNNHPGLGYPPTPIEILSESVNKLSERLAIMERSIDRMQGDIDKGKTGMVAIQDQLTTLETATRITEESLTLSVAAAEAKATTLRESFDKNQDHLSLVHKAVKDTQQLLTEMEQTTKNLDCRLPVIESRAERMHDRLSTLEDSAGRTQNHITTVERAFHQTQDHVSVVQQLVVTGNAQLSMIKQSSGTTSIPEPTPPSAQSPAGESWRPAVEARVEKLERSAQEQRKVLRAIDRRLPQLETDLGTLQGSVASLTHKVNLMEIRSDDEETGTGNELASSVEGSPVMFPNHLSEGPSAV